MWKDCPDNKFNKQKKKELKDGKSKKPEEQEGQAIHAINPEKKKTPIVKLGKHESDLEYNDDYSET